MDKKALPIGIENFEELQSRNYYFVDKTLMIKDLIDIDSKVSLFTRPRRFGKTLNISMMKYFFEFPISPEQDKRYLFEHLKIWQAGENYRSEQGQYPVISFSLKGAEKDNFEASWHYIADELKREYVRHSYLLNSSRLKDDEKKYIESIWELEKYSDKTTYEKSLKRLSYFLNKHYDRKVIILIDEYDVPINKAYISGYYDDMIGFIRGMLHGALKTNDSLYKGILTGCLRVSKESIFTGLNNPKMNSILSSDYAKHYGFTQNEVDELLSYYELNGKRDEVRRWYNGYLFGESEIYNPWSIISYVDDHKRNYDAFPQSYWVNTSGNDIVKQLVDMAGDAEKEEIENLISGGTIKKIINESVTYNEIKNSVDNMWNFLFFTGYLTTVSYSQTNRDIEYTLKIPNEEVLYIYEKTIYEWFKDILKKEDFSVLRKAFIDGDTDTIKNELNDFLLNTISYNDYKEDFYHGLMAGILSRLPGYIVRSNRESGSGRTDLTMLSRKGDTAILFEFKIAKSRKVIDLETACKEALNQIEEKQYTQELIDYGYQKIIKYGIAFSGKFCRVMRND